MQITKRAPVKHLVWGINPMHSSELSNAFSICRKTHFSGGTGSSIWIYRKSNYKYVPLSKVIEETTYLFVTKKKYININLVLFNCFALGISNMVIERPRELLTRFTHARRSVYRSEAFY